MIKKPINQYHFTVEGETERWYLEWLRDLINENDEAMSKVSIICKVQKNPVKYAKSANIMRKTVVYHLCDYESDEQIHKDRFYETMDNLKAVTKMRGRQISYKFDYSNLTFDLWIILHKTNEKLRQMHRDHYVRLINSVFGEHFENMNQFKHENNFKRILKTLTLNDVILAVRRAKRIMQQNAVDYAQVEYKGYKFYKENPATMVWEPIETILTDCGLMERV